MFKAQAIFTPVTFKGLKQAVMGLALAGTIGLTWITQPRSFTAAVPAMHVWQGECFAPSCQPNRQTSAPQGIRNWVSWKTGDSGIGKLVLGPFSAPASLTFALVGYPNTDGNKLYVERMSSGELRAIEARGSESWHEVEWPVPESWHGEMVQIVAVDGATGGYGWLGMSEPFDRSLTHVGVPRPKWVRALRAFAVAWLMLFGLWSVAMQTPMCVALGAQARPLAGVATVFLCGYAVFWLYFLDATVGYVASAGCSLLAVVGLIKAIARCDERVEEDVVTPVVLTGILGVFFTALLTVSDVPLPMAELAQHRLTAALPVDNSIPGLFADRLYAGQSPKRIIGDWLSSDRPPLQTGWILMARPLAEWMGIDRESSTYVSGIIAQLPWVPATWWLIRWLRFSCGIASLLCTAFAATGFFAQNTLFVWPKLLAAALAIGAGLLVLADGKESAEGSLRWRWAAVFAASATLAHGGAWFSNLGLVPFFLASKPWRVPLEILWACAFAACIVLPWMAYQKCYEPPGDRLLKWHLAGQTKPDGRRLSAILAEAYRNKSLKEIIDARGSNVAMQFNGNYRSLVDPRTADMMSRRADEFRYSFRAVGWWNLGWLLCPLAFARSIWRRSCTPFATRWSQLLLWAIATFVFWIGLLFMPNTATIHHGSCALQILLFVLPAVMIAALSNGLLLAIVALSASVFLSTWAPMPPWLEGQGYSAPAVMLAAVSWILACALSSPRRALESFSAVDGGRP